MSSTSSPLEGRAPDLVRESLRALEGMARSGDTASARRARSTLARYAKRAAFRDRLFAALEGAIRERAEAQATGRPFDEEKLWKALTDFEVRVLKRDPRLVELDVRLRKLERTFAARKAGTSS